MGTVTKVCPIHARTDLPAIEGLTLERGMRVILQVDRRLPLVATAVCYPAGSRHDPPSIRGLAHLVEHLAFFGDGPRGALPDWIRRGGGVCRASTLHDTTTFCATLPAHHLEIGLWVEAERMDGEAAAPPPEVLEAQRSVLVQERNERIENRPYGKSFEILHRMLYPPAHPYHCLPAGSPGGIASATAGDVESFRRAHYTPNGAVLVVVGDFEPRTARWEVERLFGLRAAGQTIVVDKPAAPAQTPLPQRSNHHAMSDRVPSGRTYIAFQAPGFGQPGWYAASLLVRSLAVGRGSPLQRKLVFETGVASEVSTQMLAMQEASTLILCATAAPGVDSQRLETAFTDEFDRSLAGDVSQLALNRARKKTLTDHFWAVQRLSRRARMLATLEAYFGEPERLETEGDRFLAVRPDEVASIGRKLGQRDRRVVLSIKPRREF